MFKLLIVDDELITRKGIRQQIDFKQYNIDRIEEADDGLKALQIVQTFQPDIVISDIKMPKMDGIGFAFELKKYLPNCRIIFMSAYTDLDYYKNAIKLNAISYIEKPIDLDEMKAAVKNAVEDLMQYLEFKNMSTKMNQMVMDNMDVLKSQLSALLISSNIDQKELNDKTEALNYDLYSPGHYLVIIINQNSKGHLDPYEQDNSKSKASHILKTCLQPLNGYQVWHYKGDMIIINLITKRNDQMLISTNRLIELFEDIYDRFNEYCKPSIAIGKVVSTYVEVYQSYQSAVITMERLFYKEGKLISAYESQQNSGSFKFSTDMRDEFTKLLEKDEQTEAILFVRKLTQNIRTSPDATKNMIKDIYFQMAQLIEHFIKRSSGHLPEHNPLIWDEISYMVSLKELEKYIIDKIKNYYEALNEQSKKNSIALRVMQYINMNYEDMTLSIDSIAEELGVSNPYLCAVFKKETNQTINKYITSFRIEKSKALLKDLNLKIEDVAGRVGYADSDYFSKVFKKYVLCTPTEYRKKYIV